MWKKVIKLLFVLMIVSIFTSNNAILYGDGGNYKINKNLTAKDELSVQDFQINGLYIEQPITEVTKLLGKPISKILVPNKDGFHEYDQEEYHFPGIVALVDKSSQKIIQLQIQDKRFKTLRGIGIGDKKDDVYYHYGKKDLIDNMIFYQMFVSTREDNSIEFDLYYMIVFEIKDEIVTKIYLNYAPSIG